MEVNSRRITFLGIIWECSVYSYCVIQHFFFPIFSRYQIPDNWPYEQARQLFKEPEVCVDDNQLEIKWTAPDEEVTRNSILFFVCDYVYYTCTHTNCFNFLAR